MNLRNYDIDVNERYVKGWPVRAIHIRVRKKSGRGGITWDTLQKIKDEIAGVEATAIEIYPPASEVVDEINARHLWVVPWDMPMPSLLGRHRF